MLVSATEKVAEAPSSEASSTAREVRLRASVRGHASDGVCDRRPDDLLREAELHEVAAVVHRVDAPRRHGALHTGIELDPVLQLIGPNEEENEEEGWETAAGQS